VAWGAHAHSRSARGPGRVDRPKRGHQWTQKVGALSQWKRSFEFPTEIGNAIFILVGHNLRLHGCFLDSFQAVLATVGWFLLLPGCCCHRC
jgi:hypothetical protein